MSVSINDVPNVQKHKKHLEFNIDHIIKSLEELKNGINENDTNKIYNARFDINITSRVISRTVGCLSRAIVSAKKPKKEYVQPPLKVFNTPVVNTLNQGLVDALITKAESYPADKIYQQNAYITVAEIVAKNVDVVGIKQLYRTYDIIGINNYISIGKSIKEFIIEYYKNNS